MTKKVFKIQENYDFDLIGISSHNKEYRVSYEINKALNIDLKRLSDHEIQTNKKIISFPFYQYDDKLNYLNYTLITNIVGNGYLISEKKEVDFLFIIKGIFDDDYFQKIITNLNNIDLILTAFSINPYELKSKQNLIF